MDGERYAYLIHGQPRALLADALIEYRRFVAAHPDDENAPLLAEVSRNVHAALHEKRRVLRAIGEPGKVNATVQVSAQQRAELAAARRARLARKKAA